MAVDTLVDQSARSPSEIDVRIGGLIRHYRIVFKLSQEELASRVGVRFQQIQKYEKGINRVSVSRLLEIANALNLDPAVFLDGFAADDFTQETSREILSSADGRAMLQLFLDATPAHRTAVVNVLRSLVASAELEAAQ